MGSSTSRLADLATNEFLHKFVGKEKISPNDCFWEQFLSFSFVPPRSAVEQRSLDESVQGLCRQLLANNPHSANLGSLVVYFVNKSTKLRENDDNSESPSFCWPAHNALFVLRVLCKFLVENISEDELVKQFQLEDPRGETDEEPGKLDLFLSSLVELLVDLHVRDVTYVLHLEAINCLLVLLSVQLFTIRPAAKSPIFRALLQGRSSIHSCLLVKRLLVHFTQQEKAPPGMLGSRSFGGSIVINLASELWNMLTFGMSRQVEETESVAGKKDLLAQHSPLASQSLLLMLVLANHCTNDKDLPNPFRQALFSCTNSVDSSGEAAPSKATATFKLDFSPLYTALCQVQPSDQSTLLLYLLVHKNLGMRSFMLARADLEMLVVPILRTLYHAPDSNSHHIYMSLIILLVLSEDEVFNKTVHQTKLKGVSWYTERSISEISLGGLLVLVVIRTIQYNMLKVRDKYLHTNCLAALANMSGQFRCLHPYVSQRLVSLFETLARKHTRLAEQVAAAKKNATQHDQGQEAALTQDLAVLEEVLRMVLEILNSCLSHQLTHNPNLVYTLLYKRDSFEPFRAHPAFQDVVCNIDAVISYFAHKLQQSQKELSESEVLATIQQGAMQWPRDRLKKFPDLKFKYVEEDRPEDFFIPYVWSLVCQSSGIHWNLDKIKLFVPESKEVVC